MTADAHVTNDGKTAAALRGYAMGCITSMVRLGRQVQAVSATQDAWTRNHITDADLEAIRRILVGSEGEDQDPVEALVDYWNSLGPELAAAGAAR